MQSTADMDQRRAALQTDLDTVKNRAERNRPGQFATPGRLAVDMLGYARTYLGQNTKVRFLDPALGTGVFYSALLNVFPKNAIESAVGYEIDSHYGTAAAKLWEATGLDARLGAFTPAQPPETSEQFNLLICNPPYVRNHYIASADKQRLQVRTRAVCGVGLNGLAVLYCYFLGMSHAWLADGGVAGWLIPSEFMDVNYGVSVKRYLLDRVTLLHIHRFDPHEVQFGDALVSSAVVWFRKEKPPHSHTVRFSYGSSLQQPTLDRRVPVNSLRCDPKWTRYPMKGQYDEIHAPVLADLFKVQRGLATGNNSYFILSFEEIKRRKLPMPAFRSILPSPRYIADDEIAADDEGNPVLERRLFVLDCRLEEAEIEKRYPTLWAYLVEGKAQGIAKRYLCRHRTPWYMQGNRSPAPFVCTYLGRNTTARARPFRFILNNSQATAANVYLMLYPKRSLDTARRQDATLKRRLWKMLNDICPQAMRGEGRVHGGGLYKLEPKELGNIPATAIAELLPDSAQPRNEKQPDLFEAHTPLKETVPPKTHMRQGEHSMDRKYWSFVIPALEPDFAPAVKRLEDRGFAGVTVPQVYGSPFAPLAAAAVSTTRLELATGIAIGLTRSPFETAVTSLDLDHLSKGRFILGLGTGPKHWTNGYFGMPYDKPVSRLREVVQILRHVEDGARSGEMQPWEGQFYQLKFDAYQPTLPPYRDRIPVWIAALRQRMCELTGEVADGLIGRAHV